MKNQQWLTEDEAIAALLRARRNRWLLVGAVLVAVWLWAVLA